MKLKAPHLWALAGYLLLTALVLWPIVLSPFDRLPGSGTDVYMYTWTNWWFHKCFPFNSPFYTDYLLRPDGHTLVFHSHVFGNAFLIWPLQFLGPVAMLNLLIFSSFVVAAYGAYLLAVYLGLAPAVAFVVGLINGFNPYRIAHLNQLNLLNSGWLAVFVLLCLQIRPQHRWVPWAAAGCAAMQIYSCYYYGAYLLVMAPLLLLWTMPREKKLRREHMRQWIKVACLTALLLTPIFAAMRQAHRRGEWIHTPRQGLADFYTPDVLNFALPSPDHLVWGEQVSHCYRWLRERQVGADNPLKGVLTEFVVYPGWTVLFLAGAAIYYKLRDIRFIAAMAAMSGLLMLGTHLSIAGNEIVPLPGKLVTHIPIANSLRVPARISAVWMLLMALMAGYGIQKWVQNRRQYTMVLLLVVVEYLPAIPWQTVEIPPLYRQLAQDAEDYTIIEIPFGIRSGFDVLGIEDTRLMLYATIHGKKRFGGMIARLSPRRFERCIAYPVLRTVYLMQQNLDGRLNHDPEFQRAVAESKRRDRRLGKSFLEHNQVRYILVHRRLLEQHSPGPCDREVMADLIRHLRSVGRVLVIGE